MERAKCLLCGGEAEFLCKAALYPGAERDIARCGACGAAFYSPLPDDGELSNCYQTAYYGGFLEKYWKDYRKGLRLGAELKRIKPAGRYLDVGCALGTMLAGVRDASGWEVSGTEFSAETARTGLEINGVEITAAPALGAAGFKADSFDYIFANNVIEHLPDPRRFLEEAKALLKHGGCLRLTTPNGETDISPNELLWKKKGAVLVTRHGGHIWFYSERSLRLIFEKAGFETVAYRGFHFLDALKSRGLWPGALRRFEERRRRPPRRADAQAGSAPLSRSVIPPETGRAMDSALALWRRLFRIPGLTFGGDFDILLRANKS